MFIISKGHYYFNIIYSKLYSVYVFVNIVLKFFVTLINCSEHYNACSHSNASANTMNQSMHIFLFCSCVITAYSVQLHKVNYVVMGYAEMLHKRGSGPGFVM